MQRQNAAAVVSAPVKAIPSYKMVARRAAVPARPQICDAAGVAVDRRVDGAIEALYAERLAAKARPLEQVDDRVLASLDRLRSSGLKLAVISNCSIEEVAAWENSALAPLFDDVAFSYREGVAKPDPAIYLASCSRLGVDPANVVFVGDGGSHELARAR